MWKKMISFVALLGLCGCERPWVYNPLSFECIASPVIVLAPKWKVHDLEILQQRLDFYAIPLAQDSDRATFEIVCDPIVNDSFDNYADTVAKTVYRNYHSSMHVLITRLQTKEVVLDTTLHSVQTLKDNPHVYQDSQIAQANVIWSQQLDLFDKLAMELKGLCEFIPSGTE